MEKYQLIHSNAVEAKKELLKYQFQIDEYNRRYRHRYSISSKLDVSSIQNLPLCNDCTKKVLDSMHFDGYFLEELRKGDRGNEVFILQRILNKYLSKNEPDKTLLKEDGIFGDKTNVILKFVHSKLSNRLISNDKFIEFILTRRKPIHGLGSLVYTGRNEKSYFTEYYDKKQIVIHHTAGGHDPNNTMTYWDKNKNKVSTAFVIGRSSLFHDSTKHDGRIHQYFNPNYWAYHIGSGNQQLDKHSIGIELCSAGPLLKKSNGVFFSEALNRIIPKEEVEIKSYRGYDYWHKYTDKQIESLKDLVNYLCIEYGIEVKSRYGYSIEHLFDLNYDALSGKSGIYTHTNYRFDKTDCYPEINLTGILRGKFGKKDKR